MLHLFVMLSGIIVAGAVAIGSFFVKKACEQAIEEEKNKQEEYIKKTNESIRNITNYKIDKKISIVSKIIEEITDNIEELKNKVQEVKKHIENLFNSMEKNEFIFSPNRRKSIEFSINNLQKLRDTLEGIKNFYFAQREKFNKIRVELNYDNNLQIPAIENLPEIVLSRGDLLSLAKDDLINNTVNYENIEYIIDDIKYKEHFINISEELENIPALITYYNVNQENKRFNGHLSLSRGRLAFNKDCGKITFDANIIENREKIIGNYFENRATVPFKSLKDLYKTPNINDKLDLNIWFNDRYYDKIIAGELPPLEDSVKFTEEIALYWDRKFNDKLSISFNKRLVFNLKKRKESYEDDDYYLFLNNENKIYVVHFKDFYFEIIDIKNRDEIELDVNREFVYFEREVINYRNDFSDEQKERLLLSLDSLYTEYEEEIERRKRLNSDKNLTKRILFYNKSLNIMLQENTKKNTIDITIESFDLNNRCCIIPDLYSAIKRVSDNNDGFFGYDTPKDFGIKIKDSCFLITKFYDNKVILNIRRESSDNLKRLANLSNEKGYIFLIKNGILDKIKESYERFKNGKIISSKIFDAIVFPQKLTSFQIEKSNDYKYNLNETQKGAVDKIISTPDIFVLQGPPGTGKTSTIAEVVYKVFTNNPESRILVTSHSHVAIDNALEKIVTTSGINKKYIARYGSKNVSEKISQFMKDEGIYKDAILKDARIIGITTMSIAGMGYERLGDFDIAIVDEAGRSQFFETLPAFIRAKKVILVGDHKQLPPVVEDLGDYMKNELSEYSDLYNSIWGKSLFEELVEELPDDRKCMLDIQYRMDEEIGGLISELFYDGMLKTGKIVSDKVRWVDNAINWVNVIDGVSLRGKSKSLSNNREANEIVNYAIDIAKKYDKKMGIEPSIAIITPYKDQKELIEGLFSTYLNEIKEKVNLKIATVDSFQGQEAEIVIYSATKTSGNPEFLSDERRLNVTISRARHSFIVFGNYNFLCNVNNDKNYFRDISNRVKNVDNRKELVKFSEELIPVANQKNIELIRMGEFIRENILFLTLGQRDIQLVYNIKQGDKYIRDKISDNFDGNKNYKYIYLSETIEKSPDKNSLAEIIGVTFPMVEKSLRFLYKNEIKISRLYLVCTDREEKEPDLSEIYNYLENNNKKNLSYYIKDLIKYIKSDLSNKFADYIKKLFSNIYNIEDFGINNNLKVDVIYLGRNFSGFSEINIDKIKEIENNDEEILNIISKIDINNGEFFYPAIDEAIKRIEIENKNIYLSLSGGMPLLQRTFQHYLSINFNSQIKEINLSERSPLIFQKDYVDYYNYFENIKIIKNELIYLNLIGAKDIFFNILYNFPHLKDNNYIIKIGNIFKDYFNNLDETNLFNTLYSRLLLSFYRDDYANIPVILKSMQEVLFDRLLEPNLDWEYKKNNFNSVIIDGKEVDKNDFFNSTDKWQENKAFRNYLSIYYYFNQKIKKYILDKNFNSILKWRNNFLHCGIVKDGEELKKDIISFLNIKDSVIDNMKQTLKKADFDEIYNNENSFYNIDMIKEFWIIWNNGDKNRQFDFSERKICNEIIGLLSDIKI